MSEGFRDLTVDELNEVEGGIFPVFIAAGYFLLGFASAAAFDFGRSS